jgi:hypothetical protein
MFRRFCLVLAVLVAVATVGVAAFVSHPGHAAHAHGVHPVARAVLRAIRYTHRGMGFAILAVMVLSRMATRHAAKWAEPIVAVALSISGAVINARLAEVAVTSPLVEQAAMTGAFGALAGMVAHWLDERDKLEARTRQLTGN